jgi:hypothetical protein
MKWSEFSRLLVIITHQSLFTICLLAFLFSQINWLALMLAKYDRKLILRSPRKKSFCGFVRALSFNFFREFSFHCIHYCLKEQRQLNCSGRIIQLYSHGVINPSFCNESIHATAIIKHPGLTFCLSTPVISLKL